MEIVERQKINDGKIFMTHRKTIFFLPILISLPEASVATRRGTSLGSSSKARSQRPGLKGLLRQKLRLDLAYF